MTRREQLTFCRKCTNRKFDQHQGIICRLTDKKADFEDECLDFEIDHTVEDKLQPNEPQEVLKPGLEVLGSISDQAKDKLRHYQDFPAALIGGTLAALISALLWAIIDVGFEMPLMIQILAKGAMIGLSVRYFGAGIDLKFGILGGALAFVSCAIGIVFTEIGLMAKESYTGFLEALNAFDYTQLYMVLDEVLTPIDYLFFAVATYEGYRLAFRGFSTKELNKIDLPNFDPIPPGHSYKRFSTLIASVVLLGMLLLINLQDLSVPDMSKQREPRHSENNHPGDVVYYPDGSKMAQGMYSRGLRDDLWSFWYPDSGGVQARGFFKKGIQDSDWSWYYTSGSVTREGSYSRGLKTKKWYNYYDNGRIKDSCQFVNGREQGPFMKYYNSGELKERGSFRDGIPENIWTTYFKNGQKQSEQVLINGLKHGLHKKWSSKGSLLSETRFTLGRAELLNGWDINANQTLVDGEGYLKEYYATGELKSEGKVSDKQKTGVWKTWFINGTVAEEGEYINGKYHLYKSWTPSGLKPIVDVERNHQKYDSTAMYIQESGRISHSLREGLWTTYYPGSTQPMKTATFHQGELKGPQIHYYPSGVVKLEGSITAGRKTGEWKTYFENGTMESSTLFVNGVRQGQRTVWHQQGVKLIEERYLSGQLWEEKVILDD